MSETPFSIIGDGRTIAADCEYAGTRFEEGERRWLSWAMAHRDPALFPEPNTVDLDRKGNRHFSFGLGIHRCIGSDVARTVFKRMLIAVLDRMPDLGCDPDGVVHYDTIGIIQGMRHLPATFTPGPRLGPGLDETCRTCSGSVTSSAWPSRSPSAAIGPRSEPCRC